MLNSSRYRRPFDLARLALALGLGWLGVSETVQACHLPEHLRHQEASLTTAQMALVAHGSSTQQRIAYSLEQPTACVEGTADIFRCDRVDLLAHLPLGSIGGGSGNDVWGWNDPATGREYALIGRSNGTAFVDVTDPEAPLYLGNLRTAAGTSAWRDIKTYRNHAFIVADFAGNHGMQVFDLTQLRNVANPPAAFTAETVYDGFARAHNVAINEETGFAYAVGSETCGGGGLHMVDIRNPTDPSFAGCFSDDGYTHDTQCVVYRGPDTRYQGREVCFASNEDTVTVVDVQDKDNPQQLSRTGYENAGYTHQGWLTNNHAFFVHDDELDEREFGHNTKTYVWDMSDLENPRITGAHVAPGSSIDHNQYIKGRFTYQANYRRGLRILRLNNLASAGLEEVAFFDTFPESDGIAFDGAWSVYPYLRSGAVIVSDINRGLFILRPRLGGAAGGGGGGAVASSTFADDFEAGNVDLWSKKRMRSLQVVSPGLQGSKFAVRAQVNGDPAASFLGSTHPARETAFRATMTLDPNSIELPADGIAVMQMLDRQTVLAELVLEPEGAGYRLSLWGLDGGVLTFVESLKMPTRATPVGLEFRQASAPGATDGLVGLVRRGNLLLAARNVDNGDRFVDEVRVGLPKGSTSTATGFLIDDYASGPLGVTAASAAADSGPNDRAGSPPAGGVVRSSPTPKRTRIVRQERSPQ